MDEERDKARRGVLTTLLQLHKDLTRIEFAIWPVAVAIGVAVGFYRPVYGVAVIGLLSFMIWVYFDARKHLSARRNRRPKEDK